MKAEDDRTAEHLKIFFENNTVILVKDILIF